MGQDLCLHEQLTEQDQLLLNSSRLNEKKMGKAWLHLQLTLVRSWVLLWSNAACIAWITVMWILYCLLRVQSSCFSAKWDDSPLMHSVLETCAFQLEIEEHGVGTRPPNMTSALKHSMYCHVHTCMTLTKDACSYLTVETCTIAIAVDEYAEHSVFRKQHLAPTLR